MDDDSSFLLRPECLTHTFVTASENQIQYFNKK